MIFCAYRSLGLWPNEEASTQIAKKTVLNKKWVPIKGKKGEIVEESKMRKKKRNTNNHYQ